MRKIYTPENITHLGENEVFVFGSNLAGEHCCGSARFAYDNCWIRWGTGKGMDEIGMAYAFPTIDERFCLLSEENLLTSFRELLVICVEKLHKTFLLTKVGCGIAGVDYRLMRDLFRRAVKEFGMLPENLIYPKEFDWDVMTLNLEFDSDGVAIPQILIDGEPIKFKNIPRELKLAILKQLPRIRQSYVNEFIKYT